MTRLAFNFGNALFHFRRTGGPRGFVRRYALTFALAGLVIQAASVVANWPVYEIYLRMFAQDGGDMGAHIEELNAASMKSALVSILMFPLGILFWMVFETASLRRYMRADRFRLRIGADEWRVLVVGLIWGGLLIGAYIGLFIVVLVPIGLGALGGQSRAAIGAIIGLLAMLAYLGACVWAIVRLSPAAALTVRDGQIRFFEAWRVTKGKAGTLFAAWLIMILVILSVAILLYGSVFAIGFAQLGPILPALGDGTATSADIRDLVTMPAFWGPFAILLLVAMVLQGAAQHIFGGPAALAAKTDPAWADADGYAQTFG